MTVEELVQRIASVPPEKRRTTALPEDWCVTVSWEHYHGNRIDHEATLSLVDAKILGMEGFRYCFAEYAKDCWRRCSAPQPA